MIDAQELINKLSADIVKKVLEGINAGKKEWLSEEDIENEFGISRVTLKKWRDSDTDPLPYSRFSHNGKFIYYHRTHINRRLYDNLTGIPERQKKKEEATIVHGIENL